MCFNLTTSLIRLGLPRRSFRERGGPAVPFPANILQHRLLITINLVIPETQHVHPATQASYCALESRQTAKSCCPPSISTTTRAEQQAIDREVAPHWMLTRKFEITKTLGCEDIAELSFSKVRLLLKSRAFGI